MDLKENNLLQYEDEINLFDCFLTIWKWKYLIIMLIILFTGLTVLFTMAKYPERHIAECSFLLNFEGIEKHRNPDGTLFEKEQIISPPILMKSCDTFIRNDNNKDDLNEIYLREIVDIKPVIPFHIQKKIKESKTKGDVFAFFPNHFNLTLTMDGNNRLFSIKEAEYILMSIINEYRAEFEKKYGEAPLFLSNFPDNFLRNSDYLDAIKVFKNRVKNFIVFLDTNISKAGFFRSHDTFDSFVDIKGELVLISDIDIPSLEAIVKEQALTKNRDDLINKYKYEIRLLDIARKKSEKEALIAHNLLKYMRKPEKYQQASYETANKNEANLQIDSSFIKNLIEKDTTSFLLKKALNAGVDSKKYEVDIEVLEKRIALLNETKGQSANKNEKTEYIQKSLMDIKAKILSLAKRANQLNIEFNKKIVNNAVQLYNYVEINKKRDVNIIKIAILACGMSLIFSVMLPFFIEYVKNNRKK